MSIALYEMAHSPFCIPIAQVLQAAGLAFHRVEVPNWDRRELLRLTNGAYYQVPVLIDEERVIFESGPDTQDVARYLDSTYLSGHLFPSALDGIQAILLDFIENELEALTFKLVDPQYLDSIPELEIRGMIIRHKERKFGRGCVEQWRREASSIRAQADSLLERFELTLQSSHFLLDQRPTYSDFALRGILGNLTFRNYNALNPKHQAIQSWLLRMEHFRF